METNPSYALLLTIKDIINNEVEPILSQTESTNPTIDFSPVTSRLDTIINFLNNIRPKLYGLFTCQPSFSITSVDQIVPFSVSFGGSLLPNADGSITLPANATYLIDFEVNGSYSVSSSSTYYIYDCDTGNNIFSVISVSENNTTTNDVGELRVSELAVGSAPRRIGVKVYTKQVSGTLILSQYQTFIKVVEV